MSLADGMAWEEENGWSRMVPREHRSRKDWEGFGTPRLGPSINLPEPEFSFPNPPALDRAEPRVTLDERFPKSPNFSVRYGGELDARGFPSREVASCTSLAAAEAVERLLKL